MVSVGIIVKRDKLGQYPFNRIIEAFDQPSVIETSKNLKRNKQREFLGDVVEITFLSKDSESLPNILNSYFVSIRT